MNDLHHQHLCLTSGNCHTEAAAAWPPRTAQTQARVKRTHGLRILVVDDDHEAADSMAVMLTRLGNKLCISHDGFDALKKYLRFQPEVLLLDIEMPGMDGYELARRIRAMPGGQEVLLIALTGCNSREDKRKSAAAGFDHHSVKPVDAIILQGQIEVQIKARQDEERVA